MFKNKIFLYLRFITSVLPSSFAPKPFPWVQPIFSIIFTEITFDISWLNIFIAFCGRQLVRNKGIKGSSTHGKNEFTTKRFSQRKLVTKRSTTKQSFQFGRWASQLLLSPWWCYTKKVNLIGMMKSQNIWFVIKMS